MKRIDAFILAMAFLMALPAGPARAEYRLEINKGTNELTLFDDSRPVKIFPVATGAKPWYTPEGVFTIVNKLVNPYYAAKHIPGGSPDNPLGPRWMGLSAGSGEYGIHGNNDPSSIGRYVSLGCIRLKNEDVIWLFDRIPAGTRVEILNRPAVNYRLYVDDRIVPLEGKKRPFLSANKCFVPVLPAAEAMGYAALWNDGRLSIKVGGSVISISPETGQVMMNNHPVTPAAGTVEREGNLYAPLDFFSLAMGGSASHDGQGNLIIASPLKFLAASGMIISPESR